MDLSGSSFNFGSPNQVSLDALLLSHSKRSSSNRQENEMERSTKRVFTEYSKERNAELKNLEEMQEDGLRPNDVTYNTLLPCYGKQENGARTLKVLDDIFFCDHMKGLQDRCFDIFHLIWMSHPQVTISIPQLNRHYHSLQELFYLQIFLAKILQKGSSLESEKDSFIYEFVKVQAQSDIERALKIAQTNEFKRDYYKNKALIEMVKVQVQINIDQAFQITQTIEHIGYKCEALIEIVKVQVQSNIEEALKTAQTIENDSYKNKALIKIVKIQLQSDIEGALKTAQKIENNNYKDTVLLDIVKVQVQSNIEQAFKTTQTIEDDHLKHKAWRAIIKKQMQSDIKQALKTVELMENIDEYDDESGAYMDTTFGAHEGLIEIVNALITQGNIEQALEIIQSIIDGSKQSAALVKIFKILKKNSFSIQAAEQILDKTLEKLTFINSSEILCCFMREYLLPLTKEMKSNV